MLLGNRLCWRGGFLCGVDWWVIGIEDESEESGKRGRNRGREDETEESGVRAGYQ